MCLGCLWSGSPQRPTHDQLSYIQAFVSGVENCNIPAHTSAKHNPSLDAYPVKADFVKVSTNLSVRKSAKQHELKVRKSSHNRCVLHRCKVLGPKHLVLIQWSYVAQLSEHLSLKPGVLQEQRNEPGQEARVPGFSSYRLCPLFCSNDQSDAFECLQMRKNTLKCRNCLITCTTLHVCHSCL